MATDDFEESYDSSTDDDNVDLGKIKDAKKKYDEFGESKNRAREFNKEIRAKNSARTGSTGAPGSQAGATTAGSGAATGSAATGSATAGTVATGTTTAAAGTTAAGTTTAAAGATAAAGTTAAAGSTAAAAGASVAAGAATGGIALVVEAAVLVAVELNKVKKKIDKKLEENGIASKETRNILKLSPIAIIILIIAIPVFIIIILFSSKSIEASDRLNQFIICAESHQSNCDDFMNTNYKVDLNLNKKLIKFNSSEIKKLAKEYTRFVHKYYQGNETVDFNSEKIEELVGVTDIQQRQEKVEELDTKRLEKYLSLEKEVFKKIEWYVSDKKETKKIPSNHMETISGTELTIPKTSIYGKEIDSYISMVSSYIPAWIEPYAMYIATADEKYSDKFLNHYINNSKLKITLYKLIEETTTNVSEDISILKNIKGYEIIKNYREFTSSGKSVFIDQNGPNEISNSQTQDNDEKASTTKEEIITYIPVITYGEGYNSIYESSYRIETDSTSDTTVADPVRKYNEVKTELQEGEKVYGELVYARRGDYYPYTIISTYNIENITTTNITTTVINKVSDQLSRPETNVKNYEDAEANDLKTRTKKIAYDIETYSFDNLAFALEQIDNYYKNINRGVMTADGIYIDYSTLPEGKAGWPVDKATYPNIVITSCPGLRKNPTGSGTQTHGGLDIAGHGNGTYGPPVSAIMSGKVKIANSTNSWGGGYGHYVVIEHDNGYFSLYGHLYSLNVTVGQEVIAGQPIGIMGTTGNSTGVHLHLEIRYGGNDIWSSTKLNPMYFFDESTIPEAQRNKCKD